MAGELKSSLYEVLSYQYALYLKTQNYHWNVEGAHFSNLHSMFESQYTELSKQIDATAEHIRSLGEKVSTDIGMLFSKVNASPANEHYTEIEMISDLIQSHTFMEELLSKGLRSSDDEVVNGFLVDCMTFHRRAAWILKSSVSI